MLRHIRRLGRHAGAGGLIMDIKRTMPTQPLLQGRPYTPAAATDITKTWLRHGWQPPCRQTQEETKVRLNPMGVPA